MRAIIWVIAGLDTSGGAGLTTDILACNFFDVHCCPILTSVVSQDNQRVFNIHSLSATQFQMQILAISESFKPNALKLG